MVAGLAIEKVVQASHHGPILSQKVRIWTFRPADGYPAASVRSWTDFLSLADLSLTSGEELTREHPSDVLERFAARQPQLNRQEQPV